MFTKIDKKVLIILIIAIIAILVSAFFIYKYAGSVKNGVEDTAGGIDTEGQSQQNLSEENNDDSTPQIEIKAEAVTGNSNGESMLLVCLDKCGDNICQDTEKEWTQENENANSICPETFEECPQDCK